VGNSGKPDYAGGDFRRPSRVSGRPWRGGRLCFLAGRGAGGRARSVGRALSRPAQSCLCRLRRHARVDREISFVDKRPETFWETLGPDEYGVWANVKPHPRWSQAQDTFFNDGQLRSTMIYNGYAEQVASLHKGLDKEPLFM
jgi:hypothetical protein